MKQSSKKITRGQMVYAPINTTERSSRSPFNKGRTDSGRSLVKEDNVEDHQFNQASEYKNKQQSTSKVEISSPEQYKLPSQPQNQTYKQPNQTSSFSPSQQPTLPLSPSPFHDYQLHLQQLTKQNQILKSRQQIYINKLLKLQEGLHRQHQQFMNLQQLYTQLFNVYKQKQEEFAQLQMKYKETQRSLNNSYGSFRHYQYTGERQLNNNNLHNINNSISSNSNMIIHNSNSIISNTNNNNESQRHNNNINYNIIEDNNSFKNELTQLIYQNKRLNQTNEKLISELNYIKSKHNLNSTKLSLQNNFIAQITDTQKLLQQEKQHKLQIQYQNKYLQIRNQDLQKTVTELENIITLKQTEIIKIRQDKLNIKKQSSQKIVNKSPPKQDSARSKSSNTEKKFNKLIDNLQKENHKLREENLKLKERIKSTLIQKQPSRILTDSHYTNHSTMTKRLDFGEPSQKSIHYQQHQSSLRHYQPQSSLRNYQNENFNSQNINQQYFSFSRQSDDKCSEEDLPSFPVDLQIEGIIRKHQQANNNSRPLETYQAEPEQQQHEQCSA